MSGWVVLGVVLAALAVLALHDVLQPRHTILRVYPLLGHLRYFIEGIGPQLRQYVIASNDQERPFTRDQRSWVYASAKKENDYFGFGTDNELERSPHYLIIKQDTLALEMPHPARSDERQTYPLPAAKVLGGARGRPKAFRPASVVNLSAMSYGSLSAPAVEALNRGAAAADCLQNTGEGGITPHHDHGGELIWQIGTGYFGCRDADGGFSLERLQQTLERQPRIRALEIKLSQGAKPGVGGILPAAKVTPEIARIRGVPMGRDCVSPATHSAFHDADGLLDFAERLGEATGLPVGIKSAVGQEAFWTELARLMAAGDRGVDFITVDGGEGGTGAAPLVFSDHVALPFKLGFARVYRAFAEQGVQERVAFIGSGKLGFPETALFAFGLGCDMVNLGREAMLAIGCVQSKKCHTGHCPTGVTSHHPWRVRGIEPVLKGERTANYLINLRKELIRLSRVCGQQHPALVTPAHLEILDGRFGARGMAEVFDYKAGWGLPSAADQDALRELMG
ncbi:FMN-binding glutamate synthase family protein [Ectothiorhodospiraceae bacterium WFHF3C12]|nr:FMN-binding glutamate synthase family protein [Ectothiorhodospiraceae bacterium WFHF3C12]